MEDPFRQACREKMSFFLEFINHHNINSICCTSRPTVLWAWCHTTQKNNFHLNFCNHITVLFKLLLTLCNSFCSKFCSLIDGSYTEKGNQLVEECRKHPIVALKVIPIKHNKLTTFAFLQKLVGWMHRKLEFFFLRMVHNLCSLCSKVIHYLCM